MPLGFGAELLDMLELIDIHIYNDQRLWTQLCRLVRQQIRHFLWKLETGDNEASTMKGLEAVRAVTVQTLFDLLSPRCKR